MRGEGMADPITETGLFPGGVCQMIRVGEDTGTLDHQLEVAATFYGKELEYKLERLTSLFEPASSSSWASSSASSPSRSCRRCTASSTRSR